MTDDEINDHALQLIGLLEIKEIKTPSDSLENIKGISSGIKLGEVDNLVFSQPDENGDIATIYASVGKDYVGLSSTDYPSLRKIAYEVIDKQEIYSVTDIEFIERIIFDWTIQAYKENRASYNLLTYIEQTIDKEAGHYHFFFNIEALGIESNFEVGLVKIIFFTNEVLEDEFKVIQETTSISREDFDVAFSKMKANPLAHICTYGTFSKAKKDAKQEASLAINALKCFLINHSLAKHIQLLDIDFNSISTKISRFLTRKNVDSSSYNLLSEATSGATPTIIDNTILSEIKTRGFMKVSNFLKNKSDTAFCYKIQELISDLGNAFSNRNLYERTVKIISFFESALVPENRGRAKGQSILKNQVLPKINIPEEEIEKLKIRINLFYSIRDKYLHNRKELPISLTELQKFQYFALYFLIKTIELKENISTMEEYFKHFGIPSE